MDSTQRLLASMGLELLKRAVLLVLYKQPLDWGGQHRRPLRQDAIRKRLDIPKRLYHSNRLMRGILEILEDDDYVEFMGEGRWRITEEGVPVIEG